MSTNLFITAAVQTRVQMGDPLRQEKIVRGATNLPRPKSVLDVLERLESEPTCSAVVAEMAAEAGNVDEEWLEGWLLRYARAALVEKLRPALDGHARHSPTPARAGVGWRFDLVHEPINNALERLRVLAGVLPADACALQPEANIDAGTTAELAETRDLLRRLGRMVGWLPAQANRFIHRELVLILDPPLVDPARVLYVGGEALSPSEVRDGVQYLADASRTDADQVIVDVLRGRYPQVDLRPATNREQVGKRLQRIDGAHRLEVVSAA